VFLLPVVTWAAARTSVPRWVPWIAPCGVGIWAYTDWHHDATCTGCGDPQPGLIALVGSVSVAVLVVGIVVGYFIRSRAVRREREYVRVPLTAL
jgi:hypothetical protein